MGWDLTWDSPGISGSSPTPNTHTFRMRLPPSWRLFLPGPLCMAQRRPEAFPARCRSAASAMKGLLCARRTRITAFHVSERSRGPGSHVSRGRGQVCTGPRLPAQGALPRLKHVLHSCLSSHHLAPFSWVPAGLSACARCAWRKARAVSATQRGPGWAVWGTGRDGSRVRGPGSNQNTVIHSTDIYPSGSCQVLS